MMRGSKAMTTQYGRRLVHRYGCDAVLEIG